MRATLDQGLMLLLLLASARPFGHLWQPAVPHSSTRPVQDIVLLKLVLELVAAVVIELLKWSKLLLG